MTQSHDHAADDGLPSASVSATYDRLAARWDTHIAPTCGYPVAAWTRRADRFLRYGDLVVDLGCGTATPAAWILAGRYRYVGVDLSAAMTARAIANAPGCTFHNVDMTAVSFADGEVGAVLCIDAINHLARDRHAELFRSVHGWLRRGGVLIANFHTADAAEVWDTSWLGAGPMYWSSDTVDHTIALLEAAGFAVIDDALLTHDDYDGVRRDRLWVVAQRARGLRDQPGEAPARLDLEGPTD